MNTGNDSGNKQVGSNPVLKGNIFGNTKFDVEHALNIYADSYALFEAPALYDEKFLNSIADRADTFHIYMIGYMPSVIEGKSYEENGMACISVFSMAKEFTLKLPIPPKLKFSQNEHGSFLIDEAGEKFWPNKINLQNMINDECGGIPFTVKYIGQAYGSEGSRNAIDRLKSHETLQKIAVKGTPKDSVLCVFLISLNNDNKLITVFYPTAKHMDTDGTRKRKGLDKLFGTTEAERIALYEASLIRYFAPEFNKEFKNSFPSTNLKVLQDCYNKDFLGLVTEINFDSLPMRLCSETVKPKLYHIVQNDLQNDAERKMFFSMPS